MFIYFVWAYVVILATSLEKSVEAKVSDVVSILIQKSFIQKRDKNFNHLFYSYKASYQILGKGIKCASKSPLVGSSNCSMTESNGTSFFSIDVYFKDDVVLENLHVNRKTNYCPYLSPFLFSRIVRTLESYSEQNLLPFDL